MNATIDLTDDEIRTAVLEFVLKKYGITLDFNSIAITIDESDTICIQGKLLKPKESNNE